MISTVMDTDIKRKKADTRLIYNQHKMILQN